MTYIIIGTSAAGISVAQKLRSLRPDDSIICISDEQEQPYNKCFLADYIGRLKNQEQLYTASPEHLQQKNITLMLGKRVTEINPERQQITLDNNQTLSYDSLFIGTGSCARWPVIEALSEQENVFTFYSLADMNRILDYIQQNKPKTAVVIGAGLSGLESADALLAHGIAVSVVEMNAHVLPQAIDAQAAALIQEAMNAKRVMFYANARVTRVLGSTTRLTQVVLDSGDTLAADLVICAIGLQPNSHLALKAGIACQDGYIVTNEYMQTSMPGIYAAGDACLVKEYGTDQLVPSCTWPDAMFQGIIAAHAMAGVPRVYPGILPITSSAFFGLKFAVCGLNRQVPTGYEQTVLLEKDSYQKLIFQGKFLKGFCLVGPTISFGHLKRAILTGQPL